MTGNKEDKMNKEKDNEDGAKICETILKNQDFQHDTDTLKINQNTTCPLMANTSRALVLELLNFLKTRQRMSCCFRY